jgi:hypothetical protein
MKFVSRHGSVSAGSVRKIFKDNFNRSDNAGSLGQSSDGSMWSLIRGAFSISTNKAMSSDAASSYPIATVDMNTQNVSISIKGATQGTTAALWVTDSGNWFGVGVDQTTVSASTLSAGERALIGCNCGTCEVPGNCASPSYPCSSPSYPCGSPSYPCGSPSYPCGSPSYPCASWSYTCNVVGNRYCKSSWYRCANYAYNCNAYNKSGYCKSSWYRCAAYAYNCNAYNAGNCNNSSTYNCSGGYYYACGGYYYACGGYYYACGGYFYQCDGGVYYYACGGNNSSTFTECSCQTCYPQYVRFIQSVSNTVTQLASWMVSSVIQSFKVVTSGTSVTTTPYSDTSLATQIGSGLTHTPTGIAINARYGIMIKPSSYNQGNSIEEITIESI